MEEWGDLLAWGMWGDGDMGTEVALGLSGWGDMGRGRQDGERE